MQFISNFYFRYNTKNIKNLQTKQQGRNYSDNKFIIRSKILPGQINRKYNLLDLWRNSVKADQQNW